MTTNQQQHIIKFHNDEIIAFVNNGNKLVAVKPICTQMGIDWDAQNDKLNQDPLFSSTIVLNTTVGADGKLREMKSLPLELFPMWLAKLNATRVKNPEAKEKVLLYQKEAAKALFEYFFIQNPIKQPEPAKQLEAHKPAVIKQTMEVSQKEYIGLLKTKIELLELKNRKRRNSGGLK